MKKPRILRLLPRNTIARSPLMGKGGFHVCSRKTVRQQSRAEIARILKE
jgi:hypothetical protein